MASRAALVLLAALAALVVAPTSAGAQSEGCTDYEWHHNFEDCLDELPTAAEEPCKVTPVPSSPDSGMAGWFADTTGPNTDEGLGYYTRYGYAGYQLPTYGQDCFGQVMPDGASAANALANLEFNISTAVIGATNSMRQAAWEPESLWGWSHEFMETGSRVVFDQVFSVFGAVTIGVVGLYLLWRSRQADMSVAVTTAGWAVLILVLVTAVARWPVESAGWADRGLTAGLNISQNLIADPAADGCINLPGATQREYDEVKDDNPHRCIDTRSTSVKASDMAVGDILHSSWTRAVLGQSPQVTYRMDGSDPEEDDNGNPVVRSSNIAYKYGPALYDAQALTWAEAARAQSDPQVRASIIEGKQQQWRDVAAAIEREDPEAYEHLTGARGWERTGTGMLSLLTSLFFALFDLTASILIILGFMIVRFAVIALPIIGTIALLRPANAGFKRLVNAVIAAIINVIVFAVAAVLYLFAANRILGANLPDWLQVVLIGLMGVAAWMLLRPYRRLTTLRGGSSAADSLLGRTADKRSSEKQVEVERRREISRSRRDSRPESQPDREATPGRQPGQRETTAAREAKSTDKGATSPAMASSTTNSPKVPIYRPSQRK
ncbi:hypothetical protein [Natronoglycomyces albus]|uniref:MFS transporter n=1 Tax=Natronoglycomyces albus TaxID=2811108 RepID=A0A895XSI2_9ACTN|nr:hypothetical protein [Natronoglycomyces albus]QSB05506.1 hypothetical protein JQS30_00745 [Natronoglycomyces albus]